jgi:hypothetical protein
MRPRRPAPGGRHRRHPACAFRRDRHDARRQRRVIGLYGPDAMGRWPGHRVPRVLWSRTLLRRSVNCETAPKVAAHRGDRLPGTHAAGPEAPSSGDIRFACAGRAGRASAPASRVGSARRACAACARVICGAPSALARVCMRSSVTSCARVAYRVRRAAGKALRPSARSMLRGISTSCFLADDRLELRLQCPVGEVLEQRGDRAGFHAGSGQLGVSPATVIRDPRGGHNRGMPI